MYLSKYVFQMVCYKLYLLMVTGIWNCKSTQSAFLKKMFIFEREHEWGGAERGEQRIWSWLSDESSELNVVFELTNCEIMIWAEVGCSTNWVTEVPLLNLYLIIDFVFSNTLNILISSSFLKVFFFLVVYIVYQM